MSSNPPKVCTCVLIQKNCLFTENIILHKIRLDYLKSSKINRAAGFEKRKKARDV